MHYFCCCFFCYDKSLASIFLFFQTSFSTLLNAQIRSCLQSFLIILNFKKVKLVKKLVLLFLTPTMPGGIPSRPRSSPVAPPDLARAYIHRLSSDQLNRGLSDPPDRPSPSLAQLCAAWGPGSVLFCPPLPPPPLPEWTRPLGGARCWLSL